MKPTKKQKAALARYFQFEVWTMLCTKPEFLKALDRSIEEAEVVAARIIKESSK